MTIKELSSEVLDRTDNQTNLSKARLEALFATLFDVVIEAIQKENQHNKSVIKIKNFGTFKIIQTKAVMRKLPGQSEAKKYPAKKKIKFVPSSKLELN